MDSGHSRRASCPSFHRANGNQQQLRVQLPWWDRLMRTYCAPPAAGHLAMTIGMDQFCLSEELNLMPMLTSRCAARLVAIRRGQGSSVRACAGSLSSHSERRTAMIILPALQRLPSTTLGFPRRAGEAPISGSQPAASSERSAIGADPAVRGATRGLRKTPPRHKPPLP